MNFRLSSASRALTRHVANATAGVTLARVSHVRVAPRRNVFTFAALERRDDVRLSRVLGLLSECAIRILGICIRQRRITRCRGKHVMLWVRSPQSICARVMVLREKCASPFTRLSRELSACHVKGAVLSVEADVNLAVSSVPTFTLAVATAVTGACS